MCRCLYKINIPVMCSRDFLAQFWVQEYNALIQFIATIWWCHEWMKFTFSFREGKWQTDGLTFHPTNYDVLRLILWLRVLLHLHAVSTHSPDTKAAFMNACNTCTHCLDYWKTVKRKLKQLKMQFSTAITHILSINNFLSNWLKVRFEIWLVLYT